MKLSHRRQFLHLAAGAAALPAVSRIASAQAYPTRPVRVIVGYAAGSSPDIVARLMGQWLSERLGQPFIVENRPGAGTNLGTEAVVKSLPDGYTLLWATTANAINATLYEKLNFDFSRDISPVTAIIRVPNVMEVNLSIPVKTVPEFIAHAKRNPGKLSMASSGTGATPHVAGELFKMMTGVDMVHVPYRGGAPALTDLLGGSVQIMFGTMPESIEHIRTGKLRALAVTTVARSEAISCRDMRQAPGMVSVCPRTRPPKSSTSSIKRSTSFSPIQRRRRGLPTWVGPFSGAHPLTSGSLSPKRPRNGPRW
jgi:tripartite-type tricarboxylate transporter receptor subunit TctC